jgi:hypothetical protein
MTDGLRVYFERKIAILEAEEQRLHAHIDAAWDHASSGDAHLAARELSEARWGHVPIPSPS